MKPKIGITFSTKDDTTDSNYFKAVERAGGEAFVLRPGDALPGPGGIDGLLISGGVDIEPSIYGEANNGTEEIEHARDALEFDAVKMARERGIPILGICRGCQVLNVAYGGKLIQDMKGHRSYAVPGQKMFQSVVHPLVITDQDSRLARALSGAKQVMINSRHHQAVREAELAPDMKATGVSSDGYIEVIESRDDHWVVGVQAHPERSNEVDPRFSRLFDDFINNARPRSAGDAAGKNDETVRVLLAERSYDIVIGEGLLARAGEMIGRIARGRKAFIIVDSHVQQYVEPLSRSLQHSAFEVHTKVIPGGEESKNVTQLEAIWDELLALNLGRDAVVIALGGGMIGDLAGFAAATYLRGVDFVQIPTSLLAMVDASVGGKTGVNHARGKNLLGSFWQPKLVLVDLDVLRTLPESERVSALAEIIKYGVIDDPEFFAWLESHIGQVRGMDSKALRHAIRRSCEIKAQVVGADERESGLREILNFGHTVAHAIENCAQYGTIRHGDAVALGMIVESLAGLNRSPNWKQTDHDRLVSLINAAGLPVRLPSSLRVKVTDLLEAARFDKKNRGGATKYMVPQALGKVEATRVENAPMGEALQEISAVRG
ncbi:3-dehydroquinate synthase [Candidatus Sumerlaeota bacterium]|nr:3-dehydroquinate synthase [Candidatus Sumerlaeota bacterium]